jgi:predicted transcriptional regulator
MRKKAICSERDAGRLTYRAMVDRETYIDGEVQALVDRLFGSRREDLVDFIRRGS